jgi:hypothetical protein
MDGVSDKDEFLAGTDPARAGAPPAPAIAAPAVGAKVSVLRPRLFVLPVTDPDGDPVTYTFELYSDPHTAQPLAQSLRQNEPAWTVPQDLTENRWYTWRVRTADAYSASLWTYGRLFVNTENSAPDAARISRPADGSEVGVLRPVLEVTNGRDADEDPLATVFEIYADPAGTRLVAASTALPLGKNGITAWRPPAPLAEQTEYYWRAVVSDPNGLGSATPLAAVWINTANHVPPRPQPLSPAAGEAVAALSLELTARAAADPEGDLVTGYFELDTAETFDSADLRRSGPIQAGAERTAWPVSGLADHTRYFWRVKSSDGLAESPWSDSEFFVNTANEAPGGPAIRNPGTGAWVETLTPVLDLQPGPNPDRDWVSYTFEIYADPALTQLVATDTTDGLTWTVAPPLADRTRYYWRARAEDEQGAASAWTPAAAFTTADNGVDDPPSITLLAPAEPVFTSANRIEILWSDADPDSDAEISLFYAANAAGTGGLAIAAGLSEDPDGVEDGFTWEISALPDGPYFVYAVITDGTATRTAFAAGPVFIDRTPPAAKAAPAGGTFTSAPSIVLSAGEPAAIYFTLDGNLPTEDSELYAGAFTLARSATLRFMAVDQAGNRSPAVSEAYVIKPQPNQAPVADAGADFALRLGETAELDGSGSHDPDNGPQPLSFVWRFVELPAESLLDDADIEGADAPDAFFVPDAAGDYVLELAVGDGRDISVAEVVVTCRADKPGDLNQDGKIDMADYAVFKASLGKCLGQTGFNPEADYDGDGCVTLSDYRIWYGYYRAGG